jgi:hypothetical protein
VKYNESLLAAVSECKSLARTHGHTLGGWHPVTELMHASMCMVCSEIAWVSLSDDKKNWLIGGKAIELDCSEKKQ